MQKLVSTGWRADARIIRIVAMALVHITPEYGAQVWSNSVDTNKLDAQLYNAMRAISETITRMR